MTPHIACPICEGAAVPFAQHREVPVGRWKAVVRDECWRCQVCGEKFYKPGQLQRTLQAAAAKVRKQRGLISPERIRALRARYGLSQAQLESLLGIGAKTVVRWEGGAVLPPFTISSLLGLLEADPSAVYSMAAKRGVTLRLPLPLAPAPRLKLVDVPKSATFRADPEYPTEAVA